MIVVKKLCIGTFLNILSQARNIKQLALFSTLLSFIGNGQDYGDDTLQGHLKSGKNNLVDYDDLITYDKDKLVVHFKKNIIPALKPELHKAVVLAFRDVLNEDDIPDTTTVGYESEGYTKQDIVNKQYFCFEELLANIFYYCAIAVKNIPYKDNIKEIKNDYVVSFVSNSDEINFEDSIKSLTSTLTSTLDKSQFDRVFKEITNNKLSIPNNNEVKMYCLDLINANIDYNSLKKFIYRNIGNYIYSRAQRNNYRLNGDTDLIVADAIRAYKKKMKASPETNHFNEIMLYSFLECVLGAPKIFSKLELQNKSGEFSTFSSGIHVLSLKKGLLPYNQIVLGATDTYDSLDQAVDNAFLQIEKVAASASEEYELIESTIFNKTFDAKTNAALESIILPKKGSGVSKPDKAYGIFLGYTANVDNTGLSNDEFKDAVKEKMEDDIKAITPYIESKIKSLSLENHSFYIYILPLNDALKDKDMVIAEALEV